MVTRRNNLDDKDMDDYLINIDDHIDDKDIVNIEGVPLL